MPPKPRPHGKSRHPGPPRGGTDRTRLLVFGAVGLALVLAIAIGAVMAFGGGSASAATALEQAGCTLVEKPALRGVHSIATPTGTSPLWNTDPPTSGPHYEIPAVYGSYTAPLDLAQLGHNLEHGGIYILYGKDVPEATVEQLRSFYENHQTGTIMAPLDRLGDKFALGAWVVDGDTHSGFLAKCSAFDENATSTFFRTLQFRGPERFDPSQLQPGM